AAQNASANGGAGGAGGVGLDLNVASTLTNDNTIEGGAGGTGGAGGASGTGGVGGSGGAALDIAAASTFTNNGTLTAGSAGSGGSGGTTGAAGSAGNAITGSNVAITVTNTGTITGNISMGTAVDTFNMNGGTITGNIDLNTGANVASATKGTINGIFDIGAATADATINPSSGNTVSFLNSGATALESTGLDFALSGAGTVVINGNVVDTSASATDLDQTAGTLEFSGDSAIDGALLSSGASTVVDLSTNDVTVAAASTIGTSGSTLKVTIDKTAGSSGSLATSAAVAITVDDSLIISPTIGTVTLGSAVTIIDGGAGGGTLTITTLATLQSNLVDNSARFDFTLANASQALTITPTLVSSGLSTTATEVNDVADTAFASDNTLLTALNAVSSSDGLNEALESLAPVVSGGAIVGAVAAQTASGQTVSTRMANLRIGISAGQGLASGDELAGERNFWTQGFGTYAKQEDRDGIDGFGAVTGGFALGADKPVSKNLTGGLAFSYAFTNVSSDSSANRTLINSFQTTGYGTYEFGSYFLESMFSVAYNHYEGLRNISVGSVERRARAQYGGLQSSIKAELGREFRLGNDIEITPSVSLQYNHIYISSYTESGADASNLDVDSQNFDSLYLTLKSEFSRTYEIEAGTLTPEIHIGYMYESLDEKISTTSNFNGGGGSFKTSGFDPANHSLLAGIGLTFA
ncbi:MAG: autotransporter domain-containing protein, partial [Gammaproteobacteria bacterium]|nr:autotransporter domain-containing protein [Gammaproteobacteria bacterium]